MRLVAEETIKTVLNQHELIKGPDIHIRTVPYCLFEESFHKTRLFLEDILTNYVTTAEQNDI